MLLYGLAHGLVEGTLGGGKAGVAAGSEVLRGLCGLWPSRRYIGCVPESAGPRACAAVERDSDGDTVHRYVVAAPDTENLSGA
jgi:hypothetical protein